MKKTITLLVILGFFFLCISCEKEDTSYNAEVKIDSLHQDSIKFGMNLIPENLHIHYSVINNDFADIHSYTFTVKATNIDNDTYTYIERSTNGVQGNSVKTGEIIMGIGGSAYLGATIDTYTFE